MSSPTPPPSALRGASSGCPSGPVRATWDQRSRTAADNALKGDALPNRLRAPVEAVSGRLRRSPECAVCRSGYGTTILTLNITVKCPADRSITGHARTPNAACDCVRRADVVCRGGGSRTWHGRVSITWSTIAQPARLRVPCGETVGPSGRIRHDDPVRPAADEAGAALFVP